MQKGPPFGVIGIQSGPPDRGLETGRQEQRRAQRPSIKLTQQQLEAHLWGAVNILRGKTAGQDYKNYILSLMFYKRLCDQWENEADEAIAELERQQGRIFTDAQKAVFRARGEHTAIPFPKAAAGARCWPRPPTSAKC